MPRAGEVCDDGNQLGGDGCSADCASDESCGNGVLDTAAGESCVDGNTADGDGCEASCTLSSCGDGALDAGEACDDGNLSDGDGCSASCASDERCGNGVVDKSSGELCDEGPANGKRPCSATCGLGEPVVIDGGCGCELAGADPRHDDDRLGWAWLAALGLAIALRRPRRGHPTTNVR